MSSSRRSPGRLSRSQPGAILTAFIALTACGELGASGEVHLDRLSSLTAEPEMRIGDFEDPDAGFSRIAGVDVDHEDYIYAVEAMVPEIRVFSPQGTLVRRIGRRGGGPGEFEGTPRFGVVGDTVWTVDQRVRRLTLFDRSGTVLSTGRWSSVPVPLPESYGYVVPWAMRPDGRFTSYMGMVAFSRDDPPTGVQPTDRIPVPMVLFDGTGAVTDTIGWAGRPPPRMWRPPAEDDMQLKVIQVGERRVMVPSPPTAMPWWWPLLDGYLVVEAPLATSEQDGILTVTRFGLEEDTIYSRTFSYEPIPYSAADLDSIASRAARGEAGGMVPIAMPAGAGGGGAPENWEVVARSLRGAMDFPEFQPPIESVWVGQDESIWLRRSEGTTPTGRWIVLNADGEPRGELELPADARPMWARGDLLWAADPDDFDVPWLVRFRIERG